MPVLSDGAAAVGSSVVSAYSNSKPTMSRPTPTANALGRPVGRRRVGAEEAVASATREARASDRERATTSAARAIPSARVSLMNRMIVDSDRAMDFRLTDEQELLRRSVREFAETEIRPHVREWDEAQHFPVELMPKLAALGLMGIQFPEQYGGAGMSAIDYCICIEELARVDPASRCRSPRTTACARRTSSLFGTEAQKQRYLVPLARGEKIGAWGLTESTSGSDAAGDADDGRARRRRLGAERLEDVHHARPRRRRRWS